MKSHRFFDGGFKRWDSNTLTAPVEIDGCRIKHRYELVFESDGRTCLVGTKSPTEPEKRRKEIDTALGLFEQEIEVPDASEDTFDEKSLRDAFGFFLNQNTALRALQRPRYETIWKAAHHLGFQMLCNQRMNVHRQATDEDLGGDPISIDPTFAVRCQVLVIHRLLGWVHDYASFEALGPQIEQMMFHEKFMDAMREFPCTTLRIAKLIKGERLFRFILPRVVSEFNSRNELLAEQWADGYTDGTGGADAMRQWLAAVASGEYIDTSYEVESNGADVTPSRAEQSSSSASELLTADEMEHEIGKIVDKKILTLGKEQQRWQRVEEELGFDEVLVCHVTRMHAIAWARCNDVFCHAWDAVHNSINVELPFDDIAALTQCVWRFWLAHQSKQELSMQTNTLRTILEGKPETQAMPRSEVETMLDKYPKRSNVSAGAVDHVLSNLEAMLAAAKIAIEDCGIATDDTARIWRLEDQFEDYRYPWQPPQRQNESILSTIIDYSE